MAGTWTYDPTKLSGDPKSPLYQVRRLVGDVINGDQQVWDEEINFSLTQFSNVYLAAADTCRHIAQINARQVDLVQGELKTNYSMKSKRYEHLAEVLETRGMASGGAMPYQGGTSRSDMETVISDSDRVAPAFNIGMTDNVLPSGVGHADVEC